MGTVRWKVEGMHCANCALTIHKFLEGKGRREVRVDPIEGNVSFEGEDTGLDGLRKGIEDLGYHVAGETEVAAKRDGLLKGHRGRFLLCLPFSALLTGTHLLHGRLPHSLHLLTDPWVQMALSLPVFLYGMSFFGRSGLKSLRNGIPNMNVLVALGAASAFVYSLAGTLLQLGPDYQFYETSASIITLVFLGNWMEEASMESTQRALTSLVRSQQVMANMIAFDGEHQEQVFSIANDQLRVGDLVLIRSGEQVPIDCRILWGEAHVNEAIVTGESLPVHKRQKELLIGGSMLESGTVRAQVTAVGHDTVLAGILDMVRRAQGEKPPVQQLADRISAIFVPAVVALALVTLAVNWYLLEAFTPSLMRAIAVLVIACPCAMGLATPAAVAVGMGRAARNGILFRNAAGLEAFKDIRQVVFDKTGTLTTGDFTVVSVTALGLPEEELRRHVGSLERHSSHPIARCLAREFKTKADVRWQSVQEDKGLGMRGVDRDGDTWVVASHQAAAHLTADAGHQVYVLRNDALVGWIDLSDEVRPEAAGVVAWLRKLGIRTILLSGDQEERCRSLAEKLGMDEWHALQTPSMKQERIAALSRKAPTVMVGDGINDAPALAEATLGISLSEASQIALQNAQVVLMNHGLARLPLAMGLGKHTYRTIRQNLFWAFAYNVIAIPVAAFGLLTPRIGALAMGLSDVVLAVNSSRLFFRKVA
jgi:Cu+-exporting ATPase